jgi:hypothetical protein
MVKENAALKEENAQLRAELAKIKPPWEDAPEWATCVCIDQLFIEWVWHEKEPLHTKRMQSAKTITWRETLERRPEDES